MTTVYEDETTSKRIADIAKRVYLARINATTENRSMTQKELADACSVSQATISGIENQRQANPPLDVIFKIAEVLNVNVAYLLALSDNMYADNDVTDDELDMIALYRRIDPEDRKLTQRLMNRLGS